MKNAFIPLHAKQRAAELEAKKRKEAKRKEQEARDKREAEYHAQENRKRSGRIAVKMIEQEQARLEKIKQEKWESDKVERRRAALITMNEEARNWMFLPLRLREKTKKPAGLPVDAFVAQRQRETESGFQQTRRDVCEFKRFEQNEDYEEETHVRCGA